jgi:hypothetical protein
MYMKNWHNEYLSIQIYHGLVNIRTPQRAIIGKNMVRIGANETLITRQCVSHPCRRLLETEAKQKTRKGVKSRSSERQSARGRPNGICTWSIDENWVVWPTADAAR